MKFINKIQRKMRLFKRNGFHGVIKNFKRIENKPHDIYVMTVDNYGIFHISNFKNAKETLCKKTKIVSFKGDLSLWGYRGKVEASFCCDCNRKKKEIFHED